MQPCLQGCIVALHLPIGPWVKGANDALLNILSFAVCFEMLLKFGSLVGPYSHGHAILAISPCKNFAAFKEFSWIGLASTHLL